MITRRDFLKTVPLAYCAAFSAGASAAASQSRPNILLVLADDMGYSDIGCYGGEINTPNINRLAREGVRFRKFYNTGRCCPTRASLLTGQYSHNAGMGWMTGVDMGSESYAGQLNNKCVTIAEVLKLGGYETYMCGKWHVTLDKNIKPGGDRSSWPKQRGFDHCYGHLGGGYGYYTRDDLLRDNKFIPTGDDFYLTNNVTAEAVNYLDRHIKDKPETPFFMYLAYYAPHRPLHVPEKYIKRYEGKYLKGWDVLREQRLERQKRIGLIDKDLKLSGRGPSEEGGKIPAWEDIPEEQKKLWDKRMATYAGQIECMDEGLGRVLGKLEDKGVLDNTLVIFLSDNGACAEVRGDGDIDTIGTKETVESYRPHWANASNTPYRMYKSYVHEGGIITPCIVRWPGKVENQGGYCEQIGHVIDLLPTCADAADVSYPTEYKGFKISELDGMSLLSALKGKKVSERTLFWEHEANRGVRVGKWKLVSAGNRQEPYAGEWELYDLENDPAEMSELGGKYPDKKAELAKLWHKWAEDNKVYPLEGSGWFERVKKYADRAADGGK